MNRLIKWLSHPPVNGPAATLLLRLMAGGVFLWEGVMKFIYPSLGITRFMKLGFPFPAFTASFVGGLEIAGGILLLFGLMTRWIALIFAIEMLVAILSTKIPLFLGTYPLALPPSPPQTGFWAVLHEIRSEYAQLMTVTFLLIVGPGRLSMEARLAKDSCHEKRQESSPHEIIAHNKKSVHGT